jgi:hypothetical protein
VAGILAALLLFALVGFALLLPRDGTATILAIRGSYGGVEELASHSGNDSLVRHLALRNDRGEVVTSAWVRRPLRLSPAYRVVVTYAGAKTGEVILDLIPPADDLVLVAVQYPFEQPRGYRAKARALYDIRQAAYRTPAGGMLAVDWLIAEERLDPERIHLLGASLGSVFATIHGALDERVPSVILVHGGASMPAMLDAAIARRTPAWLRPLLVRVGRVPVDTFDPARYVHRIAPRKLVVIGAHQDRRFTPDAINRFFELAGDPKEIRWTDTGHVGAGRRDIVAAVLEEITTTAVLPAAP